MIKLITISDIQAHKPMSINTDVTKKLDFAITDAQNFDLRPFLGDQLFIDLLSDFEASPSLATYEDLFHGSTYTYGGRTWKHEGIKAMLCWFAYARYTATSQTNHTAYGVVQKTNTNSDPVSEATLTRLVSQANSGALVFQNDVADFLNRNYADYPLWQYAGNQPPMGGIKIRSVGGNSKVGSSYRCRGCGRYSNCICHD